MSDHQVNVSVLGLGRMGRAIASRLDESGYIVTGWSRVSAPPSGVAPAGTLAEAVQDAEVVVLALHDGPACTEVLEQCLNDLPPGCTVVNTATIAPDEAQSIKSLLDQRGHRYLHCPIMGSVPAVATGSVTLLAGSEAHPAEATEVLETLGQVIACVDAVTAATLKLVANGVLADSLVSLGHALARGRRLGLDQQLVLDVLQRTPLAGLATAKRSWLEGADAVAHFTAGAIRKDIRLLCEVDPTSTPLLETLETAAAPDDADIGVICARLDAGSERVIDPATNLAATWGTDEDEGVLAPLVSYAKGHATGDPKHFRDAFRPTAHVEGIRDGQFVSWQLDTYCANFTGRPAADESDRSRTITELWRIDSVAHATMLLEHGADRFTDLFLLVRDGDTWQIANKVYRRAAA